MPLLDNYYATAQQHFRDAISKIGPGTAPSTSDFLQGFIRLAQGLQQDQAETERRLDEIVTLLRQR